jgi:hypothetical protein
MCLENKRLDHSDKELVTQVRALGEALKARQELFQKSTSSFVIGPLPPLANTSKCCSAARHCSHSCIVQHFVGLIVGVRT